MDKFSDEDLVTVKNSNLFDKGELLNLMHSRLLDFGSVHVLLTLDQKKGECSPTYTSIWKMGCRVSPDRRGRHGRDNKSMEIGRDRLNSGENRRMGGKEEVERKK